MMPASFRAGATTAVAFPRRCAIRAYHSCSARLLSVFHRSFEDPPAPGAADRYTTMAVFRRVRDEIRVWASSFIAGQERA